MQKIFLSIAALFAAASAAPASDLQARNCMVVIPGHLVTATTPNTAVTGLQLAYNDAHQAVLAKTGFRTIVEKDGSLGFFLDCKKQMLNVQPSVTKSYKAITFGGSTQPSRNLHMADDDRIVRVNWSPFVHGANDFLACPGQNGEYVLYVQSGSDVPTQGCVQTTLQVGTETF